MTDRGSLPQSSLFSPAHLLVFSFRMLRTDALPNSLVASMPPPFSDYEHANELPRYSSRPSADEETVAFTPRAPAMLPQSTFVKEWSQAKLVLMDQEDGANMPSYGRYGQVIGELELNSTNRIVSVTAKVGANMRDVE